MGVYQIKMLAATQQRIGLKSMTFSSKQRAIDEIKESFNNANQTYKIQEKEDATLFLNENDAEIARIVQIR